MTSGFGPLARLSAAISRPFSTFDRAAWGLGPLSPEETRSLARDRAFARPIERAVAAHIEGDLSLPAPAARALAASGEGRLDILLISEPLDRIEDAAMLCAGAAMQRHVLRVTAKADRQRLREAFGVTAYQVATQEAPTLYGGLAALGDARRFDEAMSAGQDVAAMRRRLIDFGLGLLLALVASAAPALAGVMRKRVPADVAARAADFAAGADIKQLTKLIHRRVPAWSATIG